MESVWVPGPFSMFTQMSASGRPVPVSTTKPEIEPSDPGSGAAPVGMAPSVTTATTVTMPAAASARDQRECLLSLHIPQVSASVSVT